MPADALQARIAALRAKFMAGLADELVALRSGGMGADAKAIAHRIAGVAGMLGHPAISEKAQTVESLLTDGDADGVAAAVDALEAAAQAAC